MILVFNAHASRTEIILEPLPLNRLLYILPIRELLCDPVNLAVRWGERTPECITIVQRMRSVTLESRRRWRRDRSTIHRRALRRAASSGERCSTRRSPRAAAAAALRAHDPDESEPRRRLHAERLEPRADTNLVS